MSICFKIYQLKKDHGKIKFDIEYEEYCLHKLTTNQYALPFVCALRNLSFSEYKE